MFSFGSTDDLKQLYNKSCLLAIWRLLLQFVLTRLYGFLVKNKMGEFIWYVIVLEVDYSAYDQVPLTNNFHSDFNLISHLKALICVNHP